MIPIRSRRQRLRRPKLTAGISLGAETAAAREGNRHTDPSVPPARARHLLQTWSPTCQRSALYRQYPYHELRMHEWSTQRQFLQKPAGQTRERVVARRGLWKVGTHLLITRWRRRCSSHASDSRNDHRAVSRSMRRRPCSWSRPPLVRGQGRHPRCGATGGHRSRSCRRSSCRPRCVSYS